MAELGLRDDISKPTVNSVGAHGQSTAMPLAEWTFPAPESPMLLASTDELDDDEYLLPHPAPFTLPPSLLAHLYASHFLSTWNSRLFEFGAVIFLADIFPSSLLPLSIYALVRSTAVILGAQIVGNLVDRAARSVVTRRRLEVVRASIVGGRVAVVGSCAVLLLLVMLKSGPEDAGQTRTWTLGGSAVTLGLFVILIVLACVEKLCATMNMVAVERDWVSFLCSD
jgi:iron-regulated transporter 1